MERTCLSGLVVTLVLSLAGVHSNAGVGAGGAITSPNIGQEGTLDVFIGNGSRQVVSLDVATNTWTAVGFAPAPIGAGGSLSNLFNSCDYAFAGAQSTAFFSTGGITWLCQNQRLADAPAPVGAGGALAAAPGLGGAPVDHVFALRGGGTEDFWRYSIGQDSWTALPLTPATVGDGGGLVEFYSNGAICSTSSFSVAALRGDFTSDFWCFNIDQNRWEAGPSTPAPVGPGGALAQLQGLGHIYALRGGGTEDFWRMDQLGNWVSLASTPGPVGPGGSLVGINYGTLSQRNVVYALQGGGSSAVWRYDVDTNSWSQISTVPDVALNNPPDCGQARGSVASLWPPNLDLKDVAIDGVTDPDDDPVTIRVESVFQDEPTLGRGEGLSCNFCPDALWTGGPSVQLRAERDPAGNGRVYRVNFSATDGRTGFCRGTVTVCVPHDQARACVDDGPAYYSGDCPFPGLRNLRPSLAPRR